MLKKERILQVLNIRKEEEKIHIQARLMYVKDHFIFLGNQV